MLPGSMFDEFDAIVAWSPAAHLWMGENYTALVPSWTYEEKVLPYLGKVFEEEEMKMFMSGQMTSSEYVKMIMDRFEEEEFGYEYQYICAEGAGHMVFLPDLIPGKYRAFNGGTPEMDLKYGLESWEKMMDFLHKCLD